jgi:hypothetical protein
MNKHLLAKEKLKYLLDARVLLKEEDDPSESAKTNENKRRSKAERTREEAKSKSKNQLSS